MDEIEEDSSKGFQRLNRHFFAVKKDGEVFLYQNRCPHLGTQLDWQEDQFLDTEGALIMCATHGALFLIESGECVQGPCFGDALVPIDYVIVDDQIHIKAKDLLTLPA